MSSARRWAISCFGLLLCALAAGCGGSGGGGGTTAPPTPEEQVRAAAQRVIDATDGTVICARLVTDRFIEETFEGDRQACVETTGKDDGASKQQITDVQVRGTQAAVQIRHDGGETDGVTGHVAFVRDGRTWKLDRYESDYLMSIYRVSADLAAQRGDNKALAYAPLRRCMAQRVAEAPEQQMRRFVLGAARHDPAAMRQANRFLESCPKELSAYVAKTIADSLAQDGHTDAFLNCMRRRMAVYLQATGLAKDALKGNTSDAGTSAIGGVALAVQKQCIAKDR
jgi:hypothetical protein